MEDNSKKKISVTELDSLENIVIKFHSTKPISNKEIMELSKKKKSKGKQ